MTLIDLSQNRPLHLASARSIPNLHAMGDLPDIAGRRRVAARETIVEEGEAGGGLYEIQAGVVMTSRVIDRQRRVVIDFRGAGELIGLRYGQRSLTTATSLTDVELLYIRPESWSEPGPDRLMREIDLAYRKIGALARMNSLERVADFLASYARASQSSVFELPMKRGEIADALGLTIESISRSFTEIRKAGLIRFIDGSPYRIEVTDLGALARFGSCPPRSVPSV